MMVGDRVRLVKSPFEPWDVSLTLGHRGTVVISGPTFTAVTLDDVDGAPLRIPTDCLELV